jgi:hypothetical protein
MQTEHRDLLIAYGHCTSRGTSRGAAGRMCLRDGIFPPRAQDLDAAPLYDSDETMARQVLDSGHPSLGGTRSRS